MLTSLISPVPQATAQMEERLQQFLDHCRLYQHEVEKDAISSFLLHQVMELAKDCFDKSENKLITSTYFYELSDSLEKLLIDVSTFYIVDLTRRVKKRSNLITSTYFYELSDSLEKLLIDVSTPLIVYYEWKWVYMCCVISIIMKNTKYAPKNEILFGEGYV